MRLLFLATFLLFLSSCQTASLHDNYELSSTNNETAISYSYSSGLKIAKDNHNSWSPLQDANYKDVFYFGLNDITINDSSIEKIRQHSQYLVAHPDIKVTIVGHADERGSREYNVALAWWRASKVSDYLESFGVSSGQMLISSYGKERPINYGYSTSVLSMNRRVEIFYERGYL